LAYQLVQRKPAGLLDAEIVAKLGSSTQFVIGTSNSFEVQAEGGEQFELEITSNSNVGNVELRQEEKKVSFTVEGETGTRGAAEVTIPKAMLPGEMMMVLIDGEVVVATESNDIIVKSNTETDATFEINYSHSEHTVEVTRTPISHTRVFAVSACNGCWHKINSSCCRCRHKGGPL
jgi:hypothetical protein